MWHEEGPDGGTGPFGNWLPNKLLKTLKSLVHSPVLEAPKSTKTKRIKQDLPKHGIMASLLCFSPNSPEFDNTQTLSTSMLYEGEYAYI